MRTNLDLNAAAASRDRILRSAGVEAACRGLLRHIHAAVVDRERSGAGDRIGIAVNAETNRSIALARGPGGNAHPWCDRTRSP